MKKQENTVVNLADFVENPDNPSIASDEDIARLAGKLKRVLIGLTAEIVEIARAYIKRIGGFERFAEWGLVR